MSATESDPTAAPSHESIVVELVGVYDAEGTLRGELSYWIGARLGRAHCALCDITHGTFREKAQWRTCADGLPVPFTTFHLDDHPEDIAAAANGVAPVVVVRTATAVVLLLGPDELEACDGDPAAFAEALVVRVDAVGLRWPDRGHG